MTTEIEYLLKMHNLLYVLNKNHIELQIVDAKA